MRRYCAKQQQTRKSVWHTPRRSSRPDTLLRPRFLPFTVSACFFSAVAPSERKSKPEDGRKEKS